MNIYEKKCKSFNLDIKNLLYIWIHLACNQVSCLFIYKKLHYTDRQQPGKKMAGHLTNQKTAEMLPVKHTLSAQTTSVV